MSYCRWSCDNHKSDIYCYESNHGIVIHVAHNRRIGEIPPLDYHNLTLESYKDHCAALEKTELKKIDLSRDGETFTAYGRQEAIGLLQDLKEEGYWVPDHCLAGLKEELAELGDDLED